MDVLQNYCYNECSRNLINGATLPCKIKCPAIASLLEQLEKVQENNRTPDLKLVDYNMWEILHEEVH